MEKRKKATTAQKIQDLAEMIIEIGHKQAIIKNVLMEINPTLVKKETEDYAEKLRNIYKLKTEQCDSKKENDSEEEDDVKEDLKNVHLGVTTE